MDPNKRPDEMERINTPELANAFIDEQVEAIRQQVGDKKVLLALSGGVDSSVVAALLIKRHWASSLVCVHVNHGLMRKGESEQVVDVFQNQMDANLVYVDATDRFLDLLEGVDEPGAQAQDHRRRVHPRVRGGGPQGGRRGRLPGAGHHLPRHPGVQRRREGPPQRGRPARGSAVRAGRAGEAAVQGRGARRGSRAGPARVHGGAPAVPRPGPGRALPGRHHPR